MRYIPSSSLTAEAFRRRRNILIMGICLELAYVAVGMKILSVSGYGQLALYGAVGLVMILFMCWWLLEMSYHREYKNVVCRGLAGLENGTYNSIDDLFFNGNIPRVLAVLIVQGDYDELLSDKLTCEYIGKMCEINVS